MAGNINRVVLVGNLTRDPELRHTPSGTPVCSLRLAVNTRRKDESGQWTDKPNYFDITVWGQQGENCAQYLSKGRPVAIDGRLEWREWEAQDGSKRQAVEVVAESVQFLGGRQDSEAAAYVPAGATAGAGDDFPNSPADDDIPFWEKRDRWLRRSNSRAAAPGRPRRRASARAATSAVTRCRRSTTRTSRSCAGTSPRRGRSARGGSRARAAGTRSRSRPR